MFRIGNCQISLPRGIMPTGFLLKKRIKVPAHQISNARELCKELFNITAVPSDEDGLMRRFKDLARDEIAKINEYWFTTNRPNILDRIF